MAVALPPPPDLPANLWSKYRRDVIVTLIAIGCSVLVILICYRLFLTPPDINPEKAASENVVKLIYVDAYWFHELYMRWTVVDWLLTFLATGTAISAVIKNSVSAKSDAADLSRWDIFLIVLALFAVLASAFDAKLHAGILADKYRQGDLILQGAKIDYAGSAKDKDDAETLRKKWHDAQDILASTSLTSTKPSGTKLDDKPSDKPADKPGVNLPVAPPAQKLPTPPNAPANAGDPPKQEPIDEATSN